MGAVLGGKTNQGGKATFCRRPNTNLVGIRLLHVELRCPKLSRACCIVPLFVEDWLNQEVLILLHSPREVPIVLADGEWLRPLAPVPLRCWSSSA